MPSDGHAAEFRNPKLFVHGAGLVLSGNEPDVIPQLGCRAKTLSVTNIGNESCRSDIPNARNREPGKGLLGVVETDLMNLFMDGLNLQLEKVQHIGQQHRRE